MLSLKWSLVALAAIASTPAIAVYKCQNQHGRTVYQEIPCESTATKGSQIDATPAAKGVVMESGYGKIRIGMSPQEVINSWGKPDDINRTVSKYGNREQWVYQRGRHNAQYVYFEDDSVTSISSN